MLAESTTRPIPKQRHQISLEELLSLRHWPPARGGRRVRMAIRDGHHLSHIRGRGMEYDDVRQYQPGDDIRHLDWHLMARTGEAYTKLFREERERPVFVITDLRPTMQFATRGHFKAVLASYAASMVVWNTLAQGDRVGAHLFGADDDLLFKPTNARQRVMGLMAELAERHYQPNSERVQPISLAAALSKAERYLSSGTLVYLFSDFHDVDAAAQQHLMRLAKRCELKLVLISDPLEEQLPKGRRYRFIGRDKEVSIAAGATQQDQYQQQFAQRIAVLEQLHQLRGVEFAHWRSAAHPLFACAGGDHEHA